MPVQTRSRSDKNAAVLGSKGPRQVPAFLYGLHRHMAPLPADCRGGRRALLPQGVGSEGGSAAAIARVFADARIARKALGCAITSVQL